MIEFWIYLFDVILTVPSQGGSEGHICSPMRSHGPYRSLCRYSSILAHNASHTVCTQYEDNVVGNGRNYDQAYFEISYLRAYTTGGVAPTPSPATPGSAWQNGSLVTGLPTNTGAAVRGASMPGSGAWIAWAITLLVGGLFAGVAVFAGGMEDEVGGIW